jgi:hypothetical protein
MVAKAKAGELNLDRTLLALRRANEPWPPAGAGEAKRGLELRRPGRPVARG